MDLLTILFKGLVGGALVVLFALIGEAIRPRSLAGLTSSAPSVATASLLVTLLTSGALMAFDLALGMIAGAVGLVVWCLVGARTVDRLGSVRGATVATALWFVTVAVLWAAFLR
ncbi:MAG TPA: DUF3147 family protein [Candidatus Dormibacteraeota bacterium]